MIPSYRLFRLEFNEKIILSLRRHWFVFFQKILKFIFWTILPLIVYLFLQSFFVEILTHPFIGPLLIVAASLYYLFIWLMLFYDWVDYYLDIWLVTDRQIINVRQIGLFNRTVSKQPLTRVQDVMAESKGFLPTFLHYGTVYIQTAGSAERFVFEQIPNPFKVADKINNLVKYLPPQPLIVKK